MNKAEYEDKIYELECKIKSLEEKKKDNSFRAFLRESFFVGEAFDKNSIYGYIESNTAKGFLFLFGLFLYPLTFTLTLLGHISKWILEGEC